MPSGRWTGCKPDKQDHRDLKYSAGTHYRMMGPQPTKIDNLSVEGLTMSPIFDQGDEGSCTANAGIRMREWIGRRLQAYSPQPIPLSRQALYYWERALPWNDDTQDDSGASTRDIYIVLSKIGACPEDDDPYSYRTLCTDPGEKAVVDAAPWRIGDYHRVPTLDDLKGLLIHGWCATMGFTVYPSLDDVKEDGIWNPDPSKERAIGGHEVFIRGFDDSVNGGSILIDNSWGESWGRQGSFWMPYSFLMDYSASRFDVWTCGPRYDQPQPSS
jgi:C1A family cysteine protease